MRIQKDMDMDMNIYIYIYIFIFNICLTIKKNTREYNFEILSNVHI